MLASAASAAHPVRVVLLPTPPSAPSPYAHRCLPQCTLPALSAHWWLPQCTLCAAAWHSASCVSVHSVASQCTLWAAWLSAHRGLPECTLWAGGGNTGGRGSGGRGRPAQ
eukprot:3334653-Rhodomonas_salina.1